MPQSRQGRADLVQASRRGPRCLAWRAAPCAARVRRGRGLRHHPGRYEYPADGHRTVRRSPPRSISRSRNSTSGPWPASPSSSTPSILRRCRSRLRGKLAAAAVAGVRLSAARRPCPGDVRGGGALLGGIGTDQNSLLFGVPQMNVPSVLPGQPSLIPEYPAGQEDRSEGGREDRRVCLQPPHGPAGVAVRRGPGRGHVQGRLCPGAGPFRRGTLGEATDIAGMQVSIPLLSGKEGQQAAVVPVLAVTRTVPLWKNRPPRRESVSTGGRGRGAGEGIPAFRACRRASLRGVHR